jgi:phage FluMu protein gp41
MTMMMGRKNRTEVTAAEALDALKVMERISLHNRGVGVWADMSRLAKVGMRELRGQIQNARVHRAEGDRGLLQEGLM